MEELLAYVKEQNEKTQKWLAEDPENRFAGIRPEDAQFYFNRGIRTLEELKKYDLISEISDMYKDLNGFRPRWMNLTEQSLEELERIYDEYSSECVSHFERLEKQSKEDEKIYDNLCKEYNCTREELKRWGVM